MKQARNRARLSLLSLVAFLVLFPACGGGSPVATVGPDAQKSELLSVEMGRLVDLYAYQRIDTTDADRRRRFNRRFTLVAENVVINPNISTDILFDAAGEEVPSATYEMRPFDNAVGHEELVILWDNRDGPEKAKFDAAFSACQSGLTELAPAYRGQNTMLRPVPIVPRNAALKMQFSGGLKVDDSFFTINPSAVQLLEFKGDPDVVQAVDAFRILPYRVLNKGDHLVLDTTILGNEGPVNSPGLPQSSDNVTANIRIAIPSRGSVVSSFYITEDPVADLNGVDSSGRSAVIRDFRSGNEYDGASGKLPDSETPMIVGALPMGITAIDRSTNTITLLKRGNYVPVRGRYPFVDGPIDGTGLPAGPVAVPTSRALRSGDMLVQNRLITMPDGSIENVVVRAEILQNMAIGTVIDGPLPIGLSASTAPGQEQGQEIPEVDVRVASLLGGRDSLGRLHEFQFNATNGDGADCVLRPLYYEDVPFGGGGSIAVSDAAWRHYFVRVEPEPAQTTSTNPPIDPVSSLAIEFTKPLDLDEVDSTQNLLLTNTSVTVESFDEQMSDPKRATARVVPARLADIGGEGTVMRLQPHMGFYHQAGIAEVYSFHVKLGSQGVLDLAGNQLDIYDDPTVPLTSWSLDFSLDATAPTNNIGWHTWLFNDVDEDGSLPGSVDLFGQFRMQGGRLFGADGVRFSRTADNQNLALISRISRGECWDPDFSPATAGLGPMSPQGIPSAMTAPTDNMGNPHPGLLYWQPRMFDQVFPPAVPAVYEYYQSLPQNVGRIIEPLNPRGSRMQMRYIEDDFDLSYHQPAEFGIDVDQLYWSPFNDETVFYDVFDRFSMSLAHSKRRPDEFWVLIPGDDSAMPPELPGCQYVCQAHDSALGLSFVENILDGTEAVPMFEDRVYEVNPNAAFRSNAGVKYVPFPRFDRSYTWRDSRLVTVDGSGAVIGLGGAQTPTAPDPNDDWTARISSPWVPDVMPDNAIAAGLPLWCADEGDFKGDQFHDHDPIALPLLVDFKVFADSPANGIALGANSFQVAMLGPPTLGTPAASGYYDTLPAGCGTRPAWPRTRVQTSGGEDLVTGAAVLVDPGTTLTATGGFLKDAGLGDPTRAIFTAPPGDGMMNWAQADFVRKVSTMTFGFLDSLQPQRAQFVLDPAGTPTVLNSPGIPDLASVNQNLRMSDLIVQLDPPQAFQPAGTSVVLELRGAESFGNSNVLYNPVFEQAGQIPDDTFDGRGNLLNPNYACEAYRYSQANHSVGLQGSRDTARVAATGLTRYVTEDQLDEIRDPATGLLPRYFNIRLVMTNNVDVTPSLSPSLRSMGVIYRVQ